MLVSLPPPEKWTETYNDKIIKAKHHSQYLLFQKITPHMGPDIRLNYLTKSKLVLQHFSITYFECHLL